MERKKAWLEYTGLVVGSVAIVVACVALGLHCTSNRTAREARDISRQALEQTRKQTAVAEQQEARDLEDFPFMYLEFAKESSPLPEDDRYPGHSNVDLVFKLVYSRSGQASDVALRIGTRNLIQEGQVGEKGTFFEGCTVDEFTVPKATLTEAISRHVTGVVDHMELGLLPVLYWIEWSYGSPSKRGVCVGEFLLVWEKTWPDVYQVNAVSSGTGIKPHLSAIVSCSGYSRTTHSATMVAPSLDCRWYDSRSGTVLHNSIPSTHLTRVGYAEDTGGLPGRPGIVDGGEYPTVFIRPLPGEDQSSHHRLANGSSVTIQRCAGDWVYVDGTAHTGSEVSGWVAARCVRWENPRAELPVAMPFTGWTPIRKGRWSNVPDTDRSG